jgi:metal-dependent HD superfamily phosphatase/phosphodiesterase
MVTVKSLKEDEEIISLIDMTDRHLCEIGFTEHSYRHLDIVLSRAVAIFATLKKSKEETELLEIAALLHDIGNVVNRNDHAQSGAILAYNLLRARKMDPVSAAKIMMAIGNHDESYGTPVSDISAALILADKSDVHKSRVRKNKCLTKNAPQDIHDRVNAAVEESELNINADKKEITFEFKINTEICTPMDYFEIFLVRMKMCKEAAAYLGYKFRLKANDYFLA